MSSFKRLAAPPVPPGGKRFHPRPPAGPAPVERSAAERRLKRPAKGAPPTIQFNGTVFQWFGPASSKLAAFGFTYDPDDDCLTTTNAQAVVALAKFAEPHALKEAERQIATAKRDAEIRAKMLRASLAVAASPDTVAPPCPAGLAYADYQKACFEFSRMARANGKRGLLICDDMGVGKTIELIGLINDDASIRRSLIVCPASLKINWQRELQKWLVRPAAVGIADGDYFPEDADFVIINYDIVSRHVDALRRQVWDILGVDEAHMLKSLDAQRTQEILGSDKRGHFYPMIPRRFSVFMSGTMIPNRPVELWPVLHAADPERWNDFFAYATRYCNARKTEFGWDYSGASNLKELQGYLRSSIMIRRLKSQVLRELPPKRRAIIELGGVHGALRQAEADLAADLPDAVIAAIEEEMTAVPAEAAPAEMMQMQKDAYKRALRRLALPERIPFERISQIRHETALAKLPMAIDYLRALKAEVGKVVVFAHHQDVIDGLHRAFNSSVKLVGGMSSAKKQQSIDRFQADPDIDMFIGSIQAAGVGLTLTAASVVVFVELDWVPGTVFQCEDRCHRRGQLHSVDVRHLVMSGTIDVKIANTLMRKQAIIEKAMDVAVDLPGLQAPG